MYFRDTTNQVSIVGRVADFCPVCRDLRPFTLRKTRRVTTELHTFYIVVFMEEKSSIPMGHDKVCEECNLELPSSPMEFMSVSDGGGLGLQDLVRETNPRLPKEASTRLALEARIREGKVQAAERRELVLEPFRLLDAISRARLKPKTVFSPLAAGAFVASILGLSISDHIVPKDLAETGMIFSGVLLFASLVWMIRLGVRRLSMNSDRTRYIRLEVEPLIARALRPLDPSVEELEGGRQQLLDQGASLALFIDCGRIQAEMNAAPRH